ncbi:ATP-binding protein [Haloarcula onubensis]|uniref:ATP-binding protein n=1 Tax=Haloarcula onubensis TaxID=2950539 RepID=A0ABU2FKY9_9EURY|nr:ATP-binding protein [Halomicroarcula sp. S3CR25-11]MDS0281021.1 ATP-binding protein [Halomicroarcula sp. S3CR25-11]
MGLAPYIYADRRLPDEGSVRETLAGRSLTKFGDDERLERLHRVFYPVFRVEYRYETGEGTLFGTETKTATALLDGLWEDNDAALADYADGTEDLVRRATSDYDFGVDTPHLGRSVLMQFQVPTGEAESLLPRRIQEYREQRGTTANVFLRKLRDSYGLPADFDPDGFDAVTEIERCYLPFWLAEFHSPHADDIALVSFRDPDAQVDEMRRHGWLSAFVSERPRRLATFGYEADPDRVERAIRERIGQSGDADGSDGVGGGGEPRDDESSGAPTINRQGSADGRSDGDPEVVQPDGVEMEAESVVEPDPDRSFADVGGMADLLDTLNHKVVRPLADPEAFEEYGIGVVNGVLLHGPPGCGKTHVAGALAGEVDHAFVEVSPADVTSKYMGEPAQKVEELFAIARANAPCVLFIDEIDGIAGQRDGDANMNSSEQQLVNQLLTELEGIAEEDVVVVGATNLVEDVDGAIRRSGRFDERVEVPPPDAEARRAILKLHLAGRPTAEDLTLDPVVEATAGYAASDLELLAENAARQALREDAPIGTDHLRAAADDSSTSIPDWIDPADAAEGGVVQPDGVDLQATNLVDPEPGRDFTSVGGMDELKERLHNTVVEPVQNSETYDEYGIDVLSGLLLYGPPGCGKTHLAGALAGELGHSFVEVTPADLSSKWMGEPASNVADLFEIARANAPCILFIDEIDGVAGSRRGSTSDNQQQLVNQLLTEVEEAAEHDVVTVGATNFVEDVDGALRRSGRFDERVEVPPPDATARREILDIHLSERPVADDIDWDAVVEPTAGYAASDIELLAEDAARHALRAGSEIRQDHLETAVWETHSSIADWGERARYAENDLTSQLGRQ